MPKLGLRTLGLSVMQRRPLRAVLLGAGADALFEYFPFFSPLNGQSFSRASVATYRDKNGVLQTAAVDEIRDEHYAADGSGPHTRLEAARTNELLNSTAPATQTRNLTAGTYTLWIEGTGSVDADGATDGAYGTATEGQANDLTFTVSATQDVTFTVSGTVDRFQCEAGSFRSSFIATTSSAVTRAADDLSFPIGFDPQEMTVYCKFVERGTIAADVGRILTISDSGSRIEWLESGGGLWFFHGDGGSIQGVGAPSIGDVVEARHVLSSSGDIGGVSVNGGGETTATGSGSTFSDSFATPKIGLAQRIGTPLGTGFADFIALQIAPGVHTMDEMRSLVGTA